MDVAQHFRSLTVELESLKDRVRNFIEGEHWLTDGEWKESVLRSFIAQRLPDTVKIGRGFVLTDDGPTTQIDILLYRGDRPVLFREGDLVFLTPDSVLGVVEVKSRLDRTVFCSAVNKLAKIGRQLGRRSEHCCLGIFSYEVNGNPRNWILEDLPRSCDRESEVVELINLGCSQFVKWWKYNPYGGDAYYEHWHSYQLENMSAGYFIANLIDSVSGQAVSKNDKFWFPESSKEGDREDAVPFRISQRTNG